MPGESISFDITASGDADRKFRQTGDAALYASGKIDIAAASVKAFDDATTKMGKAATTSQKAMKAHADATKLLADAENVLAGKATTTTKLLADQEQKLKDAGTEAGNAAGRFSALAGLGGGGAGVTGMGALVTVGAALAPILVTVGFGLTGLAAAAYGIYKPISNAAQATGGLQKNLHTLQPEQQTVARSLLSLGKTFGQFEQDLQPVVLGDFNKALGLARGLLVDIEPVTAATGKGLGSVLSQISKEFASGTWQQFFAFMARTAAPDLRQIGTLFTSLLQALPPLLEALQPIGQEFLTMGTDAARALTPVSNELKVFTGNVQGSEDTLTKSGHAVDNWFTNLTNHIPGVHAVNDWLTRVQNSLGYAGQAAQHATAPVQHVAQAFADTSSRITQVISPADHLGKVLDTTKITADNWGKVLHQNNGELIAEAQALNKVAGAYTNGLGPLEKYINAQLAEANDLHSLKQALQASGDKIGYNTQNERNSFSATQQYISQTIQTGNAAISTGHGIQGQIDTIQRALPVLESVRGKTAAYRAELNNLKQILDKLRAEKLIQEQVAVTGRGTWNVQGLPGPISAHIHGAKAAAAGWRVPGTGNSDSVPAMLTPGEAVVPRGLVGAVAPILKAGKVPGFASGGIVGNYGPGSVAGLPPWISSNQHATVTGITDAIAKSFASSFSSAIGGFGGAGGGRTSAGGQYNLFSLENLWERVGGPGGYLAHVAGAIALAESGGNPRAYNPSGASGLWQILGQVYPGNIFNPVINAINAVTKYQDANGFSPWVTYTSGAYLQYMDKGGWLKPGLNHVYNGTGRPEMVVPNSGGSGAAIVMEIHAGSSPVDQFLAEIIRKYVRTRGGSVQAVFGRN